MTSESDTLLSAAAPLSGSEDVARRVDAALAAFLERQHDRAGNIAANSAGQAQWLGLIGSIRDLLRGGKRLRPRFCHLGWLGAGGDKDSAGIVTAAAALELLHAFALIHDDIIDDSDIRRSMPTIHCQQAALHARSSWRGQPAAFGTGMAILAGDLCLSWFYEMLEQSGLPAARLRAARMLLYDAFNELIFGQYLDVLGEALADKSPRLAREINHYKTAKYTIERPLHLGSALAGGGPDLAAAYSRYALPLGQAFQLRDDLLGVFGDPVRTGKPVANDLRSGKATLLMAITRERADTRQTVEIAQLFGCRELGPTGVHRLREIIRATGAPAVVEDMIRTLAAQARGELTEVPVSAEVRASLDELVGVVTERKS